MATPLMRTALQPLYEAARDKRLDTHSGLLLQRGLVEHRENDQDVKTKHIDQVVSRSNVGDFYRRAYDRWKKATADTSRFRSVVLQIRTRLFIGPTGGGMLETGCLVSHSFGTPCIPGSSVKGLVAAHARERLGESGRAFGDELFGAPAADDNAGLGGLIAFHDAWWVPGSAERPLVKEIVTTHHPDYYGKDGRSPATDFDSPVPNAQVAVQGKFLFVIEGPADWLDAVQRLLVSALTTRGAGARTRSGYGLFAEPESDSATGSGAASDPGREWVDSKIAELSARPGVKKEQALRGRALAEAWSAIDDPSLRRAALADIRARWEEKGWWDVPQGGSARKAKAIYDAGAAQQDET